MCFRVFICFILLIPTTLWATPNISENEVYRQAELLNLELHLLKKHLNITGDNEPPNIIAELKPHHLWQRAYVIQRKIAVFRRKNGLSVFAPVTLEPNLNINLLDISDQVQRALTELRLIKQALGIQTQISPPPLVQNKQLIDIFNKLHQIGYEMDTINREPISPSDVYAELLRIDEDVNTILRRLNLVENATPPARIKKARPYDSLQAIIQLLGEIQRVQRAYGIETTDLTAFRKSDPDTVVPADVFSLTTLTLSELQLLKVKLGLNHALTPAAEMQQGKTPADVVQLLGYITHKLRLIQTQ